MKKTLKAIIALMLAILTCAFIFASCGKKDDDDDDDDDEGTTSVRHDASSSEWEKAFKISEWRVATVQISLTRTMDKQKQTGVLTATYKDYMYKWNSKLTQDGVTEPDKGEEFLKVISWSDIVDAGTYHAFFEQIIALDDFGYSKFDYSDDDEIYSASFTVSDATADVEVTFNNGTLAKIVVKTEGKFDGDKEYTIEATHEFSNLYYEKNEPVDDEVAAWRKSLDLSRLTKFTIDYKENLMTSEGVTETEGNFDFDGEKLYRRVAGEETTSLDITSVEWRDLYSSMLQSAFADVIYSENYGYALFEFVPDNKDDKDSKEGYYKAKKNITLTIGYDNDTDEDITITVSVDISIRLDEDENLQEIKINVENLAGDDYVLEATYTFSNVSTEQA